MRKKDEVWDTMRKKTEDMIPELTETIEAVLKGFSRSRSLPASLVKRSKIILLSAQGEINQNIANKVGLHYNHVGKWRNRLLEALPNIKEVEVGAPEKLKEEIRRILSDKERSGAPRRYTAEQVMEIIDLSCKEPGSYGYEVSQWSLPLLTTEIKKQGIADRISEKTVSRFLKMR